MTNEDTQNRLKNIKRSFRLLMNGVTSHSMREKGLEYKINWGIQLSDLKDLAGEYGKDYSLSVELWKENIRECKILATMIMPPEQMTRDLANMWIEQTSSQEIAEMAAFNLYQYLDFAPMFAYELIASDNVMKQLTGFHILARLFANGKSPNERGINEFIDQAQVSLQTSNLPLKHAVLNCISHFSSLGELHEAIADKLLSTLG